MSAALWLSVGFAAGVAHFVLLRWNTSLYLGAARPPRLFLMHAVGLQVLRVAATASLLGLSAWHGALPLLLAALGIMLARPLVLHALEAAQ
jgi:F1-F0 ATPase (N-ATPase) AtpR subunit